MEREHKERDCWCLIYDGTWQRRPLCWHVSDFLLNHLATYDGHSMGVLGARVVCLGIDNVVGDAGQQALIDVECALINDRSAFDLRRPNHLAELLTHTHGRIMGASYGCGRCLLVSSSQLIRESINRSSPAYIGKERRPGIEILVRDEARDDAAVLLLVACACDIAVDRRRKDIRH